MFKRYYSLLEAAKVLGMKARTVRNWVHVGKIKAIKDPGSTVWRIPEEEIIRIQEGQNVEG